MPALFGRSMLYLWLVPKRRATQNTADLPVTYMYKLYNLFLFIVLTFSSQWDFPPADFGVAFHEGGSGTNMSAQELTRRDRKTALHPARQEIKPRVFGFEFRRTNHWATFVPRDCRQCSHRKARTGWNVQHIHSFNTGVVVFARRFINCLCTLY